MMSIEIKYINNTQQKKERKKVVDLEKRIEKIG